MVENSQGVSVMQGNNHLEQMKQAIDGLAKLIPAPQWVLIGPDGKVWKGEDPMVLAAKATWKPAGFGELSVNIA